MLSGEIGDGGDLAALHPPPPCPGPADGAQQMRVVDAARFGRGPQAACSRSGFIRLAGELYKAVVAQVDVEPVLADRRPRSPRAGCPLQDLRQ